MNANLRSLVYPAVVALSLGAAFAAHAAGEFSADDLAQPAWNSAKTRDQVRAELATARAQGQLSAHREGDADLPMPKGRLTREEVRAQMTVERAQGNLNWMYGEDSGSFVLSQQRTQAQPSAQALAAKTAR